MSFALAPYPSARATLAPHFPRNQMQRSKFAVELEARIRTEYRALGYTLDWRPLYSPEHVLEDAKVALIGLNPGGRVVPKGHGQFAMKRGSAYVDELWDLGVAPGLSKLQREVRALFSLLGQDPEDVLAGNLVPFRSPSWNDLPKKQQALEFGMTIWTEILARPKLCLVIATGTAAENALMHILGVEEPMQSVPLNWGTYCGRRGRFKHGWLVYLPHLSRFTVITRPESRNAVDTLFGGIAQS